MFNSITIINIIHFKFPYEIHVTVSGEVYIFWHLYFLKTTSVYNVITKNYKLFFKYYFFKTIVNFSTFFI